jgi:hypothetical protein
MATALVLPAPATDTAFYVVFGLFVAAMLVLIVIVMVWAIRHDVAGRKVWRSRQEAAWRARNEQDPLPPRRQPPRPTP